MRSRTPTCGRDISEIFPSWEQLREDGGIPSRSLVTKGIDSSDYKS